MLLMTNALWGQLTTQDKTPLLRQSRLGSNANTAAFLNNVVSGNLLVATYECFAGGNCASGPTIADTLTSTWTSRVAQTSPACGNMWTWTAAANGSGADTVTITNGGTFKNLSIAEFTNVTNTLDVASGAVGFSGSGTETTPSITTTTNGALLLPAISTCLNGQVASPPPLLPIAEPDLADNMTTAWMLAGNAGSTSASFNWRGANTTGQTSIIAMKAAAALQVVTQALPDAVAGTAYSTKLRSNSGAGSVTWTQLTGTLPPGLSLNASTGVISGTTSFSSLSPNMTFRATDGAATTADSGTLTLNVRTAFATPALVQTHSSVSCSAFNIGTVTSGNLLLVVYGNPINAITQAVFTDSQSTTFASLPMANQVSTSAVGQQTIDLRFAWGFAGGSGADTLSCSASTSAGVAFQVLEFSGVQHIFDVDAQSSVVGSSASPISSGSITAPVAGLLIAAGLPFTPTTTLTNVAPYSAGATSTGSDTIINTEYNATGSVGSNTATFTQAGNTDGNWAITLFSLRPSATGTAPTPPSGHRRAQVY